MALQLPTNTITKHFTSTDPVNNGIDHQFNFWKSTVPTVFISFIAYGTAARQDGTIEYSLLVAGYDTIPRTGPVPQPPVSS